MTTPYATIIENGDGATTEFNVTFKFIERDHVKVYRVVAATGFETELTVIRTGTPGADEFIWETNGRISVGTAPTSTERLKIVRDTPENEQIVQWSDGSYIIAADLNESDLQWLYGLQELEDKFSSLSKSAIKYLGAIDLTTDPAPASPAGGDFYINTGSGQVLGSWAGIAGQDVVGSEQVVYNSGLAEWQIFEVPSTQSGVLQVNSTAPITVDNNDVQRPVVGITAATDAADGSMSAADKGKLDNIEDGAQANVNADWNAVSGDAEILNKPSVIDGDAPADGKTYGRKDSAWSEVEPGGVTKIVAGNNVDITPVDGTGEVTINSSGGVTSITAGEGISVNRSTGDVTITNTGGGGGGGIVSQDIYGTAKAFGSVSANGTKEDGRNFTVSKFDTGAYTITFENPLPSNAYAVNATILGGAGSQGGVTVAVDINSKGVDSFNVYTGFQRQGSTSSDPFDYAFDFSVFDEQPEVITSGTGTVTSTNIFGTAKAGCLIDVSEMNAGVNVTSMQGVYNAFGVVGAGYVTPGLAYVEFLPGVFSDNKYLTQVTANFAGGSQGYLAYADSVASGGREKTTTRCYFGCVDGTNNKNPDNYSFAAYDNKPAEVALTTNGDVLNYSGAAAWGSVDPDGNLLAGLNTADTDFDGSNIYTITFSNPMPNADYSVTTGAGRQADTASFALANVYDKTPTGFSVQTYNYNGAATQGAFSYAVNALDALPPMGQGTGADAWAEVDQSGELLASYNIDGCTYSAPGTYDYVFVSPMPSDNYAVVVTGSRLNASSELRAYYKTRYGFQVYSNNSDSTAPVAVEHSVVVHATNATLPLSFDGEQIKAAINNPGASAWGSIAQDGVLKNGLNIASTRLTDNGFGFVVTFATPMPDANYSITASAAERNGKSQAVSYFDKTASGFSVYVRDEEGRADACQFDFAVFATNALPPTRGTGSDGWANTLSDGTVNSSFNLDCALNGSVYEFRFNTPMPTQHYSVQVSLQGGSFGYTPKVENKTINGFDVTAVATVNGNTTTSFGVDVVVNATNATLPDTFTESQIQSVIDANPLGIAKAWVNFDGTAVTAAGDMAGVRSSFNIDSVIDNGLGDYTLNFIKPMGSADYVTLIQCATNVSAAAPTQLTGYGNLSLANSTPTATSVRIVTGYSYYTESYYDDLPVITAVIYSS